MIVDDLVSSGSTLARAAQACHAGAARDVSVAVAHALFLPPALRVLGAAKLTNLLVSDSVPMTTEIETALSPEVLPLGPYLGEALRRIFSGGSLTDLAGLE
jgi:ribose-phosphate pyrophosphokinase